MFFLPPSCVLAEKCQAGHACALWGVVLPVTAAQRGRALSAHPPVPVPALRQVLERADMFRKLVGLLSVALAQCTWAGGAPRADHVQRLAALCGDVLRHGVRRESPEMQRERRRADADDGVDVIGRVGGGGGPISARLVFELPEVSEATPAGRHAARSSTLPSAHCTPPPLAHHGMA